MHLPQRGGGQRRTRSNDSNALLMRTPSSSVTMRSASSPGKRLHPVLQPAERGGVRGGDEVRAGGQELAQLDERGPHPLQVRRQLLGLGGLVGRRLHLVFSAPSSPAERTRSLRPYLYAQARHVLVALEVLGAQRDAHVGRVGGCGLGSVRGRLRAAQEQKPCACKVLRSLDVVRDVGCGSGFPDGKNGAGQGWVTGTATSEPAHARRGPDAGSWIRPERLEAAATNAESPANSAGLQLRKCDRLHSPRMLHKPVSAGRHRGFRAANDAVCRSNRLTPVADAPLPGAPYTAGPPSPRRRTLCRCCGEFIRSAGRTAHGPVRSANSIIRRVSPHRALSRSLIPVDPRLVHDRPSPPPHEERGGKGPGEGERRQTAGASSRSGAAASARTRGMTSRP